MSARQLPWEAFRSAFLVPILARMRLASSSRSRRGFFGVRAVTTNRRLSYRPGAGKDTRAGVMNQAGADHVNLLTTLGAEAFTAEVVDEGQIRGNDVKEPKLVVFSGGTAFNSVAAGTL